MECDECKNLMLRTEKYSTCDDCIQKFYSPKLCSDCNGRISFLDLKNCGTTCKKIAHNLIDPANIRLCACFPKYPSQHFSNIQSNDANEIQLLPKLVKKAGSFNELLFHSQAKKSATHFNSHNCLHLRAIASDYTSSDDE